MRIGAVNYLNSKPLVYGLQQLAPGHSLVFDLPSRLADSLAAGRIDVALVPTVELFRTPGYRIVSNACVACRGPVMSVKLHFRVPPARIQSVALDEGSRTSAALARILLRELVGISPRWESLPIGCGFDATEADAVLLIGDRAMQNASEEFVEVWDLGACWNEWTGLPFVFALWVARHGLDAGDVSAALTAARDDGLANVEEIAAAESKPLGIDPETALGYLKDNLHFTMDAQEHQGLRRFYQLCVEHGLAPAGREPALEIWSPDGCTSH